MLDINKINKPEKVNIGLTIDKELEDELKKYKKKHKIKKLSPMINEILKNWLNEERPKEKIIIK